MTCRDYQDELYEWFGQSDLPDHLRDHLEHCEECRAIHAALTAAGAHLGDNELFAMGQVEGDHFLFDLNHRLDRLEESHHRFSWMTLLGRLAPIAAAAAILLAIAIPAHHWQKTDSSNAFDSTAVMDQIASLSGYDDSYPALDDQTVNALIEDYSSRPGEDPNPTLLDDLSEEDWNYLNQNFKVGELL